MKQKNTKRRSQRNALPKGFAQLFAPETQIQTQADNFPTEAKNQNKAPKFKWQSVKSAPPAPSCPRVGSEGEVAYPPFLVAFDAQREGLGEVESRLVKTVKTRPQPRRR